MTPPIFQSAATSIDGTKVILTYDETLSTTSVSISGSLPLKFSEPIHTSSDLGKVYLKDVNTDTLVPTTVTLNSNGDLLITPTNNLAYGTAYYVNWDTDALKDVAGNAIVAVSDETTFNFTTAAAPSGGGAGANIVFAGSGPQNIVLGEDDDELSGGDGDDIVGSTGGNDLINGDAGKVRLDYTATHADMAVSGKTQAELGQIAWDAYQSLQATGAQAVEAQVGYCRRNTGKALRYAHCVPNMTYPPEQRGDIYASACRGLTEREPDQERRLKYLDFIDRLAVNSPLIAATTKPSSALAGA